MNKHELTVYPYHLAFLKDFPKLNDWLNCEGYTILHSHQDFKMSVIYSFWDNHTVEAEKNGVNDATASLMIAYCQACKTVEVYHRAIITNAKNEKSSVDDWNTRTVAADREEYCCDSQSEIPVTDEIDQILQEIGHNFKL